MCLCRASEKLNSLKDQNRRGLFIISIELNNAVKLELKHIYYLHSLKQDFQSGVKSKKSPHFRHQSSKLMLVKDR